MRLLLLAVATLAISAQEIIPARTAPADYHAQATSGSLTLAADFQGRTVPAPSAFILKSHIVIEIAIFTRDFNFNTGHFTLKLNGKTPLLAQTAGMVGGSLKYANWEGNRGIVASAGLGNANVILGRQSAPRFPGDRRHEPSRPPGTPAPPPTEQPEFAPWDWVEKLAWADGPGKGPAAGLLYFPYQGHLGKLKTIELLYNGPEGPATLALRGSAASPAKSTAPARKP